MGVLWAGVAVAAAGAVAQGYSANKASQAQGDAAKAGQAGVGAANNLSRTDSSGQRSLLNPASYTLANLMGIQPGKLNANDAYLARYGDVASAGVNPLEHMLQYGTREGRTWGDETDAEYQARTGSAFGSNGAGNPNFGSLMKPFTGADVATDPGYQFGQQQGQLGLDRAASRNGMRLAPATLQALSRFNQDYAGTKFGEAFNRDQINKTSQFNMLSGLQGSAQVATQAQNQTNSNAAAQQAELLSQGGNARAAGIMGQANAFSSGLGSMYNNYNQTQMMSQFMNNRNTNSAQNSPYLP